jgi:hypothetical protein
MFTIEILLKYIFRKLFAIFLLKEIKSKEKVKLKVIKAYNWEQI